MSVLYYDNFSFYGTGTIGKANMLRGFPWLEAISIGPANNNPPPGQSFHYSMTATTGGDPAWRISLMGVKTTFGVCIRPFLSALPDDATQFYLFQVRDSNNVAQCTITLSPTGFVQARRGDSAGTILAESDAPAVSPGNYFHAEAKFKIDDATGAIEVRINEVTVINVSGVDTKATAVAGAESVAGRIFGGQGMGMDFTDLVTWDTTGTENNSFLGDVQALWSNYVSDTAHTDWARNTGTQDYAMLTEAAQDGDTTYLAATTPGNVSEFKIGALPATVSEVIAVMIRPIAKKTLPGTCSMRTRLRGDPGGAHDTVANGATVALSTTYTYSWDVYQVDPSTGVRFTPAGALAAQYGFEKVA